MTRYFELRSNMLIPGRWVLKSPVDEHGHEVEPWQLSEGRLVELQSMPRLPLALPGLGLDFSLTGLGVIIVQGRFVRLFERLGVREVQFIPAQVEGHSELSFILNPLRIIRCIDEARCQEVQFFTPEDGQPEKVGQYRNVVGMRIDPAKVEGARIFRPWGWTVALIVSEGLKQALEQEGITGTKFVEV